MSRTLRRCLAMSVGAVAAAALLLSAGVPGALILALAPALLCLAVHLVMGHGDPHGEELYRRAVAAAGRPDGPVHRSPDPHDGGSATTQEI